MTRPSWESLRKALARFLPAADPLVAIMLTLAGIISLATAEMAPDSTREPDVLAYGLAIALAAPLAVRRRWPIAVLATFAVGLVLFDSRGYPGVNVDFFGPVLAMYTVASLRSWRVTLAAAAGMAAMVGVADLVQPEGRASVSDWLTALIIIGGTVAVGATVRQRRATVEVLQARTAELEEARHDLARQAVTEERLRMARELHDVVAHTMSAIVIQTSVAKHALNQDGEAASAALDTIESMSREALTELRSILGVLRAGEHDDPQRSPAPRVADLEALVERLRSGGMQVELHKEGDIEHLPPLVELACFRIAQEALTNVMKHAAGSHVTVNIRGDQDEVTVEVKDNGAGPRRGPLQMKGAGRGLTGMHERVALLGGTLQHGPQAFGGFRVFATLPTREVPR